MLISLQISLISPAFASPASATYDTSPTTHTTDITVNNPGQAYDGDTGNYADFNCDASGIFNLTTFTKLTDPWRIVKVDIKIKYGAPAVGGDDSFKIEYFVGPSGTAGTLQGFVDAATGKSLGTYTWFSRSEPNDGVWSWTDIQNIYVLFTTDRSRGADGFVVNVYEVWVTVTYRAPTLYVDPTSLTVSAPFTIDINITNMEDLYAWEFNVTYDTSILTATNVQEGPFLNASGTKTSQFNKTIDDANGWVYAYCSLIGDVVGTSGGGVLANITFSIDSTGTSSLDLHNSKLVEYDFIAKKSYNYPPYHLVEVDGSVTTTAVPEFPLGAAMEIALVAVIIYVLWRHKREPKTPTFVHKST